MTKILDNIETQVEGELLTSLSGARSLDAAVGYFNLRGWRLIADAVEAMPGRNDGIKARILVGITESPADEMRRLARSHNEQLVDNRTAARLRHETVSEYRQQLEVGVPTEDDERALRALLRQIETGKVEVRVHLAHRLHAKLYMCHRDDQVAPRAGYVGSSNLTVSGLRHQGELNVDVLDVDATDKLARWFEDRWTDPFTVPAMPELAEAIRESWAAEQQLDPYLVYLKIAYHLSKEAREGLVEYGLPSSMKDKLLDFQGAAVKIAARIVMTKGGAMIGDVVGLGKTLVATAVARLLQEEQGFETLVVCPKNLTEMWKDYLHAYEVRGKVESLSMVHSTLLDERRHRLVVIDESHNLRSDKRRDYKALKDYISENDSRVLLLSATPYNKQFGDLAAQLGLFVRADADLGLRPERSIAEVGEEEFEIRCQGPLSSLAAFGRSEHMGDWQDLMSQYLVRRTRRFIMDRYASTDPEGRKYIEFTSGELFYFPERVACPVERELASDDPAAEMSSDDTLDDVKSLRLPRYRLGAYIGEDFHPVDADERNLVEDLRNSARGNLAGFTRITMFKRLSSSGPAFLATLNRHRMRNEVGSYALANGLPVPVGTVDNTLWNAEDDTDTEDQDDDNVLRIAAQLSAAEAYQKLAHVNPSRIRWARSAMFDNELRDDLDHDTQVITTMLERFGRWHADADGKLASLEELISQHKDDKVLVFTEAADTAAYVEAELKRRGGVAVGVVTGDSKDPTRIARRFSPRSNQATAGRDSDTNGGAAEDELRVLVSTDVLSEGQNLQDAHIVVNYDLPWAVVKLVQRAGRVDRIGQNAPKVLVYSLLPAGTVEKEIKLRARIRDRLGENARLLGSDEEFFGDPTEQAVISGRYDTHPEDDPQDDVDPVSMAYEIWHHAEQHHAEAAQKAAHLPNVVYSTKTTRPDTPSGVVVHTQTVTGSDAFAVVDPSGQARRVTPQEALRLAECEPDTPAAQRLGNHHDLTAAAIAGALRTPLGRSVTALQGIRKKVWDRLHPQVDSLPDNLFFTREELDAALDSINARHLYESAIQTLARAVKTQSDEELAALVTGLHKDGRLCQPPPADTGQALPAIVCTMGLRPA